MKDEEEVCFQLQPYNKNDLLFDLSSGRYNFSSFKGTGNTVKIHAVSYTHLTLPTKA